MEMKVRDSLIKKLRLERAWSQQHLADAADISLRTVQRIEKTGQASPESAKALAAAFGVKANELVQTVPSQPGRKPHKWLTIGIPTIMGFLASLVFLTHATAEPMMLGVLFSDGDQQLADVQLLTDLGDAAEVILDNGWKVSLIPTLTPEGEVRIAAKVYEPTGAGSFSLVSSPVLITDYRKAAGVSYKGENGASLDFAVTPK
ncbi:MAG: helix-turn-helix transcriptional regulator [Cellvibrionaceae bacterium]